MFLFPYLWFWSANIPNILLNNETNNKKHDLPRFFFSVQLLLQKKFINLGILWCVNNVKLNLFKESHEMLKFLSLGKSKSSKVNFSMQMFNDTKKKNSVQEKLFNIRHSPVLSHLLSRCGNFHTSPFNSFLVYRKFPATWLIPLLMIPLHFITYRNLSCCCNPFAKTASCLPTINRGNIFTRPRITQSSAQLWQDGAS